MRSVPGRISRTAAAALGVPIGECVAIEDSNTGAKSAEAAGAWVLCVPNHVPILEGPRRVFADTLVGRGAHDLGALLRPRRVAEAVDEGFRCGATTATIVDGRVVLDHVGDDREAQLDALWAALQCIWAGADGTDVLEQLQGIR